VQNKVEQPVNLHIAPSNLNKVLHLTLCLHVAKSFRRRGLDIYIHNTHTHTHYMYMYKISL